MTKAQQKKIAREERLFDLAHTATGLREYYSEGNQIRALLEELILDLTDGAPRSEITADAKALLKELDPMSTAHRVVTSILAALKT